MCSQLLFAFQSFVHAGLCRYIPEACRGNGQKIPCFVRVSMDSRTNLSRRNTLAYEHTGQEDKASDWALPLMAAAPRYRIADTLCTRWCALLPGWGWEAFHPNESGQFRSMCPSVPVSGAKYQISTAGGLCNRLRGHGANPKLKRLMPSDLTGRKTEAARRGAEAVLHHATSSDRAFAAPNEFHQGLASLNSSIVRRAFEIPAIPPASNHHRRAQRPIRKPRDFGTPHPGLWRKCCNTTSSRSFRECISRSTRTGLAGVFTSASVASKNFVAASPSVGDT